jgi:hypothetical protein
MEASSISHDSTSPPRPAAVNNPMLMAAASAHDSTLAQGKAQIFWNTLDDVILPVSSRSDWALASKLEATTGGLRVEARAAKTGSLI